MDMFTLISEIPIGEVVEKLGIKYISTGYQCLTLREDGKPTDGRRVNIQGNYVNDFSGKGRAVGSPYMFVKKYLKLNDKETFLRFSNNFGIKGKVEQVKYKKRKKEEVLKLPPYVPLY